MTNDKDLASIEDAAARYGGDLRLWPEEARVWAEELIAEDEGAADALIRARELDDALFALAAAPAPPPSPALMERVLADAAATIPRPAPAPAAPMARPSWRSWLSHFTRPAAACAASAALGLWLGYAGPIGASTEGLGSGGFEIALIEDSEEFFDFSAAEAVE